jgi:hypothetical protein
VLNAVEKWQTEVQNEANYQRNIVNAIKVYPNGLSPFISGIPLIS